MPLTPSSRHKIKTLQDILRATNSENVDNFLKDFENFLRIWAGTKILVEATGGDAGLEQVIKGVEFTWIDDGKNDAKVNVEVKDQLD